METSMEVQLRNEENFLDQKKKTVQYPTFNFEYSNRFKPISLLFRDSKTDTTELRSAQKEGWWKLGLKRR